MVGVFKALAGILVVVALALGIEHVSGSSGATGRSSLHSARTGVECVKDRANSDCSTGAGIENSEFAISPDGRTGYRLLPFFDYGGERAAIWIYDRNPATGSLRQRPGTAGCIVRGSRTGCASARALSYGYEIAISPDGRNVYAS